MQKNVYLFQPQYQDRIDGKRRYWLPYSAGCVWAYVTQFPELTAKWRLGGLFFKREILDRVLERLEDPKICGFSCYAWNEQYNLSLAKRIRERWPDCMIFFGGPQVSADYLQYDFIDTLMMAEGEQSLVDALKMIDDGKDIPSIFPKARVQDLDILPSPYALGLFDSLIAENPDTYWNTVLETNRGCPFSCTFCDWGGLTYSKVKKFQLSRVEHDLEWMAKNRVTSIYLADANFGIFQERDMEIAKMIKRIATGTDITYVSITYTKNSNENVFKIAQALYPVNKAVTISMQSMHDKTLKAIKRDNLKLNNLSQMMSLAKKYDIPTYTEMILGLPEESLETWKAGMTELLEAGQHDLIDVFFAMMIRNSELNDPTSIFQYGIKKINVKNYMLFSRFRDDDEEDIPENADIVVGSKTMPLEDMTQSWMYSWTIMNMHLTGYSQIISRYCREALNISYREFYDTMYETMRDSCCEFNSMFVEMEAAVRGVLSDGAVQNIPSSVNHLPFYHHVSFYMKKHKAHDLTLSVAERFGEIPNDVRELQRLFVYDAGLELPYELHMDHDIETWEKKPTRYKLSTKIESFQPDYYHVVLQRKRGLKNKIEKMLL